MTVAALGRLFPLPSRDSEEVRGSSGDTPRRLIILAQVPGAPSLGISVVTRGRTPIFGLLY